MRYLFTLFLLIIFSCSSSEKKLTAQQIIDKSILASGANLVDNAKITFNFRKNSYAGTRQNGKFQLERTMTIDDVKIKDIVNNNGFERFVNKKPVFVEDSLAINFANSVNSVHYFSVLPFGLNDQAVKKKLLPEITINNQSYYKIQISFSEENGGEDFDDIFIYWINKNTFFVDFLAYEFHVNGGGVRFRELKEQCVKEGIRFVDYNNYKSKSAATKLQDLDKEFENNQLKKVSEIVLKDIKVILLSS